MRKFKTEKEKIDFLKSKNDEITQVIEEIKSKFGKHIEKYSWMSGGTVEVYPIMVNRSYIQIQLLDSDKRTFNKKALDKIVNAHNGLLSRACISESDGSCPSELLFYFID